MTTKHQEILKNINNKIGFDDGYILEVYDCLAFMCDDESTVHYWLRGILLSPETMKAWWVEEKTKVYVCSVCSYRKEYSKHDPKIYCEMDGSKLKEDEYAEYDQEWRIFAHDLVDLPTNEEILEYYASHTK